jgi:aspartate kinase/aspartokinase/homoserine dehydrogenase 1
MSRSVVKFGGSNLKSAGDAARLALIVRGYRDPPVVVVSALYGVTQQLIAAAAASKADASVPASCRDSILAAYARAAEECVADPALRSECLRAMSECGERLFRLLSGVNMIGNLWPQVNDSILSFGERLSSCLLTFAFRSAGLPAEERLPEDIGLFTDGSFGQAGVELTRSRSSVLASLPEGLICVVPGFYGISERGEITLLGRGGSDYSAAAIAWCVDAVSCDIWKDVDGFMSADPKIAERALPLPRLSYAEAAELSYFGAKILHPQTVDPVERKGIPLFLYNVNAYGGERLPQTEIGRRSWGGAPGEGEPFTVKSVTSTDDVGVLRLSGPALGGKPGLLGRCADMLSGAGINIKSVITSQTCINLLVSRADMAGGTAVLNGTDMPELESVEALGGLSLIACVGEGMLSTPGVAARMFSSIAAEGINIFLISVGASPVAAYCLVGEVERNRAVQAIHREFFG